MSKASQRAKRQAQQEAQLKYAPQSSALAQILSGLGGDLKAGVAQARAGARMQSAGAKQALPQLRKVYAQAASGADAASKLIASDAAAMPAGSALRAAVDIGQAGARSRLAEASARSGKELVGRQVDAVSGGAQEVRSLRGQYNQDRQKTIDQLLGVADQAGTYASSRYGQIRSDQADQRLKAAGVRETGRHNRAGETAAAERNQIARDKAAADARGKGKPKWATPAQQGAAQDNITSALAIAKQRKKLGESRSAAADLMVNGRPGQTVKNSKGEDVNVPGVAKTKQLWASIALDIAYDGHISARNQRELKKRRIRPGRLGFSTTPKQKKPVTLGDSTSGFGLSDTVQGR